jgi:amino acid permease
MQENTNQTFGLVTIGFVILLFIILLSVISLHQQNVSNLRYKVPFVPFVPTLSIFFNIALMVNLQSLTWLRLIFWMIIGIIHAIIKLVFNFNTF